MTSFTVSFFCIKFDLGARKESWDLLVDFGCLIKGFAILIDKKEIPCLFVQNLEKSEIQSFV